MWKGGLIAIQDAGVIQHHPLSHQRDDAVPQPGDHLSVGKGDRLAGDTEADRGGTLVYAGPEEVHDHSQSRKSFLTEPALPWDSKPIEQVTPGDTKHGGCFSGSSATTHNSASSH